ncbi:polysaccharide lyase [Sandaracinus amylolyticus]|uniref:polysaccharide lyase n=1 Tax=Sandaracinus amylolyticus TaxID=927083 RepID=UPI001F173AE7|nr:polysaccharide lyase [Sandaracinus amylolyticus]UJR84584.1 Hypothetical protein I5071_66630 [Sandaracinus amylolyticus]
MRRVLVLSLLCILVSACAGGSYTIELDIVEDSTREATHAIELALIEGGCDDVLRGAPAEGQAQTRVLRRDGDRSSFAPTRGGRYGVYAVARDPQCVPLAAGCTEAELEAGGRGTIVVRLEDVSAMACTACDDGACLGDVDAGMPDAGTIDAGTDDAGTIDAGTDDAGPIDGGPVDAGSDAGPPDTVCNELDGVIFCHGFETSDRMAWTGTRVDGTGSAMTIVGDLAHLGARSARGVTTEASAQAAYTYRLSPVIDDGELWFRGHFIVEGGDLSAIALLYLDGVSDEGTALQVQAGGRVVVAFQTGSDRYEPIEGATIPLDDWVCIEARIVVHDASGSVEVWADGRPIGAHTGYDTHPAGGLDEMQVGNARSGSSQGAITVRLDDVALSRTRLGCP